MKPIYFLPSWKIMTKKIFSYHLLILASIIIFGLPTKSAAQDVIINEINYDYNEPFRGYNAKDWVELYNTTSSAVDMSGWVIADNDTIFTFPLGFFLPAASYYVVAKDALDFFDAHPTVTNVIQSELSFSASGETIKLYSDNLMTLVDSVAYGDGLPWPEPPDGEGPTLSLIDSALDNNDATNWESSGNYGGTPGRMNQVYCTSPPPEIIINEIN